MLKLEIQQHTWLNCHLNQGPSPFRQHCLPLSAHAPLSQYPSRNMCSQSVCEMHPREQSMNCSGEKSVNTHPQQLCKKYYMRCNATWAIGQVHTQVQAPTYLCMGLSLSGLTTANTGKASMIRIVYMRKNTKHHEFLLGHTADHRPLTKGAPCCFQPPNG